jgi:hypothetical protein
VGIDAVRGWRRQTAGSVATIAIEFKYFGNSHFAAWSKVAGA